MGIGVGVGVGFGRGVGVFVVVVVGRGVGVGAKSVTTNLGEDVAVGVTGGVAVGVGDAVAVRVAVTTLVGKEVGRRCSPTSRVAWTRVGGGSAPPQAEATMALTIKATAQAIAGPSLRPIFSRSQKLAGDRQIRRQTAGFGNPAVANCDLLMLELVTNLP